MIEAFDFQLAERDRQDDKWEHAAPYCCRCGWQIQDDFYYEVDDEIYCEECMVDNFRHDVDKYRAEHLYD